MPWLRIPLRARCLFPDPSPFPAGVLQAAHTKDGIATHVQFAPEFVTSVRITHHWLTPAGARVKHSMLSDAERYRAQVEGNVIQWPGTLVHLSVHQPRLRWEDEVPGFDLWWYAVEGLDHLVTADQMSAMDNDAGPLFDQKHACFPLGAPCGPIPDDHCFGGLVLNGVHDGDQVTEIRAHTALLHEVTVAHHWVTPLGRSLDYILAENAKERGVLPRGATIPSNEPVLNPNVVLAVTVEGHPPRNLEWCWFPQERGKPFAYDGFGATEVRPMPRLVAEA